MANHKSALKRIRQTEKRRLANRMIRSAYRTELKKFYTLIEENNLTQAQQELSHIYKVIDKTHSKGIFPKKTASRKKSRVAIHLQKAIAANA